MLIVKTGEVLENEEIKQQIRLHWERGLRLLKEDSKEKEMTDKMRLGKVRPSYQGRSRSDSLGATDCEVATPEHSAL